MLHNEEKAWLYSLSFFQFRLEPENEGWQLYLYKRIFTILYCCYTLLYFIFRTLLMKLWSKRTIGKFLYPTFFHAINYILNKERFPFQNRNFSWTRNLANILIIFLCYNRLFLICLEQLQKNWKMKG
jgi:hypothetical protein